MFNFFSEVKGKITDDEFNIINVSGKLLYVEGHTGLVTLSKNSISFKVKQRVFLVEGEEMILAELSSNTIKISGNIKKVEQLS